MTEKSLWVASIKAKVLDNCELDNDGSEFQYVEVFLVTADSGTLLEQVKTTLTQMGLEFSHLNSLEIYNPQALKPSDDPLMDELLQETVEQAKATEELTFGPFTSSRFYK